MCRSRGGESSNFELKSVFEISDLRGDKSREKCEKEKKKERKERRDDEQGDERDPFPRYRSTDEKKTLGLALPFFRNVILCKIEMLLRNC